MMTEEQWNPDLFVEDPIVSVSVAVPTTEICRMAREYYGTAKYNQLTAADMRRSASVLMLAATKAQQNIDLHIEHTRAVFEAERLEQHANWPEGADQTDPNPQGAEVQYLPAYEDDEKPVVGTDTGSFQAGA